MQSQQHSELTRGDIERHLMLKAWEDEAFKRELIGDSKGVWLREFPTSRLEGIDLDVLEETPSTLYLVIPWQDEEFKQELLSNPKAVWKREFGTTHLEGRAIRVCAETTNQLYLVLPEKPTVANLGLRRLPDKSHFDFEEQNTQVTSSVSNLRSTIDRNHKRYRTQLAKVMPKGKLARILYQASGRLDRRLGVTQFRFWLLRPWYRFRGMFNWLR